MLSLSLRSVVPQMSDQRKGKKRKGREEGEIKREFPYLRFRLSYYVENSAGAVARKDRKGEKEKKKKKKRVGDGRTESVYLFQFLPSLGRSPLLPLKVTGEERKKRRPRRVADSLSVPLSKGVGCLCAGKDAAEGKGKEKKKGKCEEKTKIPSVFSPSYNP